MEEDGECGKCLRSDHVLWGLGHTDLQLIVLGKCVCY